MRAGDLECRGDLVARAQRGPLSAAERSALLAHLASCESCRMIQQVASDFAELRAVDRGDESRLEEMATLARRAVRGGRPTARVSGRRWYARAAAVAAGMVLIAGTASATAWLFPRLTQKAPAKPIVASTHRVESALLPTTPATRATTPTTPPPPLIVPPAPTVVVAVRERTRPRPSHGRAAGRTTATTLLHEARAAKTDGQAEEAIALYRRLQREFPGSSEAMVSTVPMGRLLLERASPQAALTQFNHYLGAAQSGVLVPEALYGRAQAQGRLGLRDDERTSWRLLLSDFPDSPYSAVARRRLFELK